MSAPIVACELADAIGTLIRGLNRSLGCRTSVEFFGPSPERIEPFFVIYLYDYGKAFHGRGDTLSQALMEANSARQSHEDMIHKADAA